MFWAAILLGAGAFLALKVRGASTLTALLGGLGIAAVLGAIAMSQEGWDVPVPVLILMGAIGGSLASTAADRELRAAREARRRIGRPT